MSAPAASVTPAAVPGAGRERRLVSLRTELLFNLALLATAALLLAVATVVVFGSLLTEERTALWLTLLIAADVAVFVALGGYIVRRQVLRPLEAMVAAADDITRGNLARRMPGAENAELDRLATAVNWMTERLLEERAQVVRAEKMATIGRVAAGIAHEIGNPLGAINGYTYVLRQRVGGAPEGLEVVASIEREAGRIDRIVRGLLDYARERRAPGGAVSLSDTALGVTELLRAQGVLKNVRLGLTLAADLPPIPGDPHEMEQALVNLLVNAVDVLPDGGAVNVVTRRATLADITKEREYRRGDPPYIGVERAPNARLQSWLRAAGHPEEMLQLIVADSGPGVPDEHRERIFDPFFTTKEPGKGTGLGLAIVARLVDNLGGTIWVRRAREGGAAFVLLFPIARGSAPVAAPAGAYRAPGELALLAGGHPRA
ncbi:MAG TPA: ATP-binding protein [Gemmatimonadaceae bacterium]|nr:ATP-binding protein [Gemmatimonadaceae bacterium]